MTAKKVYAVARGRAVGIFTSWSECEKQVKGFAGARFQSFTDVSEALAWLSGTKDTPAQKKAAPRAARAARTAGTTARRRSTPASMAAPPTPSAPADYTIFTDGSCLRNPGGPGGWAMVAKDMATGQVAERSAGEPSTTNNRMELTAAIEALRYAPEGTRVALYTDSQYLKNGITKWVAGWKRRGWRKADGQPVLNQELWMELDRLYAAHAVDFHWVKGHAGNPLNERCDTLAKQAAMTAR
ncbi:MAG: ribonuclease HI [Veillonellaceae bacterium]|nr:ribonuclease HI [Veillonellaceae bacterium]